MTADELEPVAWRRFHGGRRWTSDARRCRRLRKLERRAQQEVAFAHDVDAG